MGCKRISKNKYKLCVELGYDIFGKRRRKFETFNGSYTEAKARESVLISKYYKKGNVANTKELTMKEYAILYLKHCKNNEFGLVTLNNYQRLLKNVVSIIGEYKLNKVTPYMLDKMYQELKVGQKGKVLGYYAMYDYYKLVNDMLNQAVKWEFINVNPNSKSKKPKKIKTEKNHYDINQTMKLLSCLEKKT